MLALYGEARVPRTEEAPHKISGARICLPREPKEEEVTKFSSTQQVAVSSLRSFIRAGRTAKRRRRGKEEEEAGV